MREREKGADVERERRREGGGNVGREEGGLQA